MKKQENKYDSFEYFKKLKKSRRKKDAITGTQAYISDYYKNSRLSFDDLIDAYYFANFGTKHFASGISNIILGIVAGVISSVLLSYHKVIPSLNANMNLWIIIAILIITAILILMDIGISFSIFKTAKWVKSFYSNDYYNFIAPYELKVIEYKLLKIYNFKPSGDFQGDELAIPNANHVSAEAKKSLPL